MFLNLLNRVEKENFLELANLIASCDGEFSTAEKTLINQYRKEVMIDEETYALKSKSLEEITETYKDSSCSVKNSVFVEIFALALIDGKFDEKEKSILMEIKDALCITDSKFVEAQNWIEDMQNLYKRGHKLVTE